QMRALLIEGAKAAPILRDVEPTVQEVLNGSLSQVLVDRPGVDETSEVPGRRRVQKVVARPTGLDNQRDAERPPAPAEERATVKRSVPPVGSASFLVSHAHSSKYRCCHGHTHDHSGPRNRAPIRVSATAATTSAVTTTTTSFRSRTRHPRLRSRKSTATVGTSTPATMGWNQCRSSCRPAKYQGAFATGGVRFGLARSLSGASNAIARAKTTATVIPAITTCRTRKCGQVNTSSSGSRAGCTSISWGTTPRSRYRGSC